MRSWALVLACGSLLGGCWITRGEIREKLHEIDYLLESGETGDTGQSR